MGTTSIVATIGPATRSASSLLQLKAAGMTVARLNGSHADIAWHRETIQLLRSTLPELPILLDIPGRKIRTTLLAHEPEFVEGDQLVLTTDANYRGADKVPVNYDALHEKLHAGVVIYADDGTLSFEVLSVHGRDITIKAKGAGKLRSRKGINVPDIDLGRSLLTSRDEAMVEFCKEVGVDFIGISFVEGADHVTAIRNLIGGSSPRIVAKVENRGGLDHLEEIVQAADVIMIDRGDLSVETGVDVVSVHQKRIIEVSKQYARPVIVATELLHSMIDNPLPTKAEIGDITNAILDGAAAVMLSGETAIGKYPVDAVARLSSIATAAEAYVHSTQKVPLSSLGAERDFAIAIRLLARSSRVNKIVVLSRTGHAARLVAMERVGLPVVAVTDDPSLARSLRLLPGTESFYLPLPELYTQAGEDLLRTLLGHDVLASKDSILLARFVAPEGTVASSSIQTFEIGKLFDTKNKSAVEA
jgi:pyruvate kinase